MRSHIDWSPKLLARCFRLGLAYGETGSSAPELLGTFNTFILMVPIYQFMCFNVSTRMHINYARVHINVDSFIICRYWG